MDMTSWILLPAVGAVIGYVTNTIAVTMIFRPHKPRYVFGLRIQGLVPKRQEDLARKIGEVTGQHLIEGKDLRAALEKADLQKLGADMIGSAIDEKIAEFASLPMIGAFLTPDRIAGIRDSIVASIVSKQGELAAQLESAISESFDVSKIVEEKVAAFSTQRLEELILEVARRELRAIEMWGAVLGACIGIIQVLLLEVLS